MLWITAGGVVQCGPACEVLPVRTPTLPPATHTNAYVVGSRDMVLVEPASPEPAEIDRIAAWIERRCAAGARLRAILLTHHHGDHVGGAAVLAQRLSAPIWAHAATRERLAGWVTVDALLEDGQRIVLDGPEPAEIQCVHTPGHAPGHLCFLETRSGAMLAGDMVASVGTILVEPNDGDMAQYLASLRRMQALKPRTLLPAHGSTIDDPDAHLEAYVAHRLLRERKVIEALRQAQGPSQIVTLLPQVYADTPQAAWPLAVLSLEAHLLKLQAEGQAARGTAGWLATD